MSPNEIVIPDPPQQEEDKCRKIAEELYPIINRYLSATWRGDATERWKSGREYKKWLDENT